MSAQRDQVMHTPSLVHFLPEREELCFFRNFTGPNQSRLVAKLLHLPNERDHDVCLRIDTSVYRVQRSLDDCSRLHFDDGGLGDAQSASTKTLFVLRSQGTNQVG